jgi:hypothetical protein
MQEKAQMIVGMFNTTKENIALTQKSIEEMKPLVIIRNMKVRKEQIDKIKSLESAIKEMPEQKGPSLKDTVVESMKQPKKWDKIIKCVDESKISKKAMSFVLKAVSNLIIQGNETTEAH